MNEEAPHPQLKDAAKEIQEVLDKYDIPGLVLLFYDMQVQTVVKLDSHFSVVKIGENRQLQIQEPKTLNLQKSKKMIATTVNMLANFKMRCFNMMAILSQAEGAVRERFGLKEDHGKNGKIVN